MPAIIALLLVLAGCGTTAPRAEMQSNCPRPSIADKANGAKIYCPYSNSWQSPAAMGISQGDK